MKWTGWRGWAGRGPEVVKWPSGQVVKWSIGRVVNLDAWTFSDYAYLAMFPPRPRVASM